MTASSLHLVFYLAELLWGGNIRCVIIDGDLSLSCVMQGLNVVASHPVSYLEKGQIQTYIHQITGTNHLTSK